MKGNEKKNDNKFGLKDPPPREYTTARGRLFEFGKPALRHRKIITKVIGFMAKPSIDYEAIVECAKKRKMEVEEFVRLDEKELTKEELMAITKTTTPEKKAEYAELLNDILAEALIATIKKDVAGKQVPRFDSLDDLEQYMDDYGEAVELFPIAIKWVAMAAESIGNINRKN